MLRRQGLIAGVLLGIGSPIFACARDRPPAAPPAERPCPAPTQAAPPPSAPAPRVLYRTGPPSGVTWLSPWDPDVSSVVDALFPKHLQDPRECRPHRTPTSWGEVDRLKAEMTRAGQFIPAVEQRVEGSFTAPSAREVLYLVSITHCYPGGLDAYRVFAVFDEPGPGHTLGAPKLRFDDTPLVPQDWRFLAVVEDPPAPPHFLVSEIGPGGSPGVVREVALNRPYASGAAFLPSESATQLDGGPMEEHWKTVAQVGSPGACATYYLAHDALDGGAGGARVGVVGGECGAP